MTQPIWAQGSGAAPQKDPVTLSPSSLSFAAQAVGSTSAALGVKLTSNQSTALNISSIPASGDFAITPTSTCGASLASGKSCTINVTFTPIAMSTRSGAITVADSASTSPQIVTLTGTGVVNLTLSATSLSFATRPLGPPARSRA